MLFSRRKSTGGNDEKATVAGGCRKSPIRERKPLSKNKKRKKESEKIRKRLFIASSKRHHFGPRGSVRFAEIRLEIRVLTCLDPFLVDR